MKLEKFLIWIQDKLLNYPDISITTVQFFINKFYECLSNKERERYKLQVQIIKDITLKQISIDSLLSNHVIDKLDNELNELKNDDNEKE